MSITNGTPCWVIVRKGNQRLAINRVYMTEDRANEDADLLDEPTPLEVEVVECATYGDPSE